MESYVLLKAPIPASHARQLLGRIIADPLRPLDTYCPEDPLWKHRARSTGIHGTQRSNESARGLKDQVFSQYRQTDQGVINGIKSRTYDNKKSHTTSKSL